MEPGREPHLIELDARRRAALGGIAKPEHRRYIVAVEPNGVVTLTPAAVVPIAEGEHTKP